MVYICRRTNNFNWSSIVDIEDCSRLNNPNQDDKQNQNNIETSNNDISKQNKYINAEILDRKKSYINKYDKPNKFNRTNKQNNSKNKYLL